MKPTTPQQIEATIAVVRAAAAGDPLDDSHTLRGHLAMVLGALDEARAALAAVLDAADADMAARRAVLAAVGSGLDAMPAARTQEATSEELDAAIRAAWGAK